MKHLCLSTNCRRLAVDGASYCQDHAHLSRPAAPKYDNRPSASRRGYNAGWRKVRARVLSAHGIPRDQWTRYDIDHSPAYNPAIEPDHSKYTLVPRLHGEHSRKTIREDGGFGKRKRVTA